MASNRKLTASYLVYITQLMDEVIWKWFFDWCVAVWVTERGTHVHQRIGDIQSAMTQCLQVVAAFHCKDNFAAANFFRQRDEHACQRIIAAHR